MPRLDASEPAVRGPETGPPPKRDARPQALKPLPPLPSASLLAVPLEVLNLAEDVFDLPFQPVRHPRPPPSNFPSLV